MFPTPGRCASREPGAGKPQTLDLNAIMKIAPLEERIYRHRCVERWSIVVPWIGFSLSALLKVAEPNSNAKYVAFQSYYDPKVMLSQGEAGIRFPYVEGLRMDEAMNSLAMLVVGVYRRNAAQSEWRALPPGGAVEVRLQEHQVHQQDQPGGE